LHRLVSNRCNPAILAHLGHIPTHKLKLYSIQLEIKQQWTAVAFAMAMFNMQTNGRKKMFVRTQTGHTQSGSI